MTEEIVILEEDKMEEDIERIDIPECDTTCTVCYAEFLDPEDLLLHINQVHANTFIECPLCQSSFVDMEEFSVHFLFIHARNVCCCKFCLRIFTDITIMRKHEEKHCILNKSIYSCSHCSCVFNNIIKLQNHEFTNHKDSKGGIMLNNCFSILSSVLNIKIDTFLHSLTTQAMYVCKICKYTEADVINYIEHLKNSGCKSYACDTCYNVYKKKETLRAHMNRNRLCGKAYINDSQKEMCNICHKLIDNLQFQEHTEVCNSIKCLTCDIAFKSVHALSIHQSNQHPLAISLKICKYCHKELVGIISMSKHIERSHKTQFHLYKYKCVYCELYYQHPQKLFAHFFSTHSDLEPYTCKICNKKFRVRKRFTLHIKLDHKSIGFVEFDERFHVSFAASKSANPFQPSSIISEHYKNLHSNKYTDDALSLNETTKSLTMANGKLENCDVESFKNNTENIESDSQTQNLKEHTHKQGSKIKQTTETNIVVETKSVCTEHISTVETENQIETEQQSKVRHKKRTKKKAIKLQNDTDEEAILDSESTDSDSDTLLKLKTKIIRRKQKATKHVTPAKKRSITKCKKKLVCHVCNKYCYTHQNYINHMSLHNRNQKKKCIKCYKVFDSKVKLREHIENQHSSSKLTETLKSLLEKRKQGDTINVGDNFRKTIKRVETSIVECSATLVPIPNKELSAKNFIETFSPENDGAKHSTIKIDTSIVLTPINNGVIKKPMIKMIKFKPEPPVTNIKLSMPVKYKENVNEKHNVTIKLVQKPKYANVKLNFDNKIPEVQDSSDNNINEYTDNHFADGQYEEIVDSRMEPIPDVAQEVMLEETEESPNTLSNQPLNIPHKILIPKLPMGSSKMRIAHLLPTAPYYKIVKVKDILKEQSAVPKESEIETKKDLKLPDGTKLVNVNPLAHLLGDTPVESVLHINKYYQPKRKNFETAIAKALLDLDKPTPRKKAKKS